MSLKHLKTYHEPAQPPLGELFHQYVTSGPKILSGSKELRQVSDTSEGPSETVATCCGLKNRHEESVPAQDICQNRHRGNPESRAAFRTIKDMLTVQQKSVLDCIRESDDGLTVNEIAEKLGATPNMVSGRASELKRDGEIYKSGTRLTRSGCSAAVLKSL